MEAGSGGTLQPTTPPARGSGEVKIRGTGRAAITTLGCKVNTFESAVIAQRLAADDWELVDARQDADLYIINSCTVTAEADRQTRQTVRRVLRQNPSARVVLTGCYAQNEPEYCAEIPGVSLVIGNDHKLEIARIARDLSPHTAAGPAPIRVDRLSSLPVALLKDYESRTRAFVQIQQGCDQSCTFCVIHRARGPSRSFDQAGVLEQIRTFSEHGYREIVLCGVDLGSYDGGSKQCQEGSTALTTLLHEIAMLPGEFRVRLSSIDPVHLDEGLLEVLATGPRFCPYLHVSLQSGSTLILKRMKRRYDRVFLLERLLAARERIPPLVLGADVMAGFPTETEADFIQTQEIIEQAQILYPHVFSYSARPGTPAAQIPRQIPKPERRRRAGLLRETGQELRRSALAQMAGQEGILLMEQGEATREGTGYHGRLANYMPVRLPDSPAQSGTFVKVRICGVEGDVLIAQKLGSE